MRRKAYDTLKEWKKRSNGSTAMLVEGARRVGKTSLVTEFAKNEYASYIIIDFYAAGNNVKKLFDDISDLDELFRGLQLYYNKELKERDSVIVFDEVQRFPRAREAIKALVHDGRYDYLETGSLVSIKKNVKGIIIPSEEEKMKLHPLDFEEFLWAKGINTFRLLYPYYKKRVKVDDNVHHHMMKLFREYLAVGGMPQAVLKNIEGRSFQEIDKVKREIIQLYLDDFRKMDPSGKLERLFLAIPSQLSSQSTRYRMPEEESNRRLKRERSSFYNLEDSQTVQICRHVNDPKVGLTATIDDDYFKMFTEDTGLFVTLCFFDKQFSENDIYIKLVKGRLSANLGYVYENAVAQALTAMGFNLFYHTFKEKDDEKHYKEIDFIIAVGDRVRPIESKSSRPTNHKSFDLFISGKGLKLETPVVISPKNLSYTDGILYLPAYMAQFLDGEDYGSNEVDDSYVSDFDSDDWIPIDRGYILYIKGKEHGKKDSIVSVYVRENGGTSEAVNVKIDEDSQHNVKITYDRRIDCRVKISERGGSAVRLLISEAKGLLEKLDSLQYGDGSYVSLRNEVASLASKIYLSDVVESKVNEIQKVRFTPWVHSSNPTPQDSEKSRSAFQRGKERLKGKLKDMISYLEGTS